MNDIKLHYIFVSNTIFQCFQKCPNVPQSGNKDKLNKIAEDKINTEGLN